MRWRCAMLLLALGGCQQRDEQTAETNAAAQSSEPDAAAPGPAPEAANQAEANDTEPPDVGLGQLPPEGAGLRFVGRWAAKESYCADNAWRFTASALDTPAGSHCDFRKVYKVPGGYDIAAVCTAEGPPAKDEITLRFAESARAMLFESDAIADAGLVYCGG
jgi:hypothetical protein